MGTKLYVGNLPFNTTENELQEIFSQAGAVQEVTLMQDRFTGKSRGFAFVTMSRTRKRRMLSRNSTATPWKAGQ